MTYNTSMCVHKAKGKKNVENKTNEANESDEEKKNASKWNERKLHNLAHDFEIEFRINAVNEQ